MQNQRDSSRKENISDYPIQNAASTILPSTHLCYIRITSDGWSPYRSTFNGLQVVNKKNLRDAHLHFITNHTYLLACANTHWTLFNWITKCV